MKNIALLLVGCVSLTQAPAQLLSPESIGGALWGGLIGGMVDGDCHGLSGEGAAIGAGIGLIAGSLVGEARRRDYYNSEYVYSTTPAANVSLGYGYGGDGSSAYAYYAPNNYCAPGYYYRPTRPNYVVSGTVLGAASGALIGAGNDDAGAGALIGAGAGLLLGGVSEYTARKAERTVPTTYQANAAPAQPQTQSPNPQPPAPKSEITSKPVATSTYYWTPRPQIADAPRVPDAPTF